MTYAWKCPGCLSVKRTEYCGRCGERRLRDRDLTLTDLGTQFVKGMSSIDGKLFRSVRLLLTSPGRLTAAYIGGERKRFMSPVALFFVGNAVFFAVQSLTDARILSSSLASHLHGQDWSALAQRLVEDRLTTSGRKLDAYAPIFDEAAIFNGKALIGLMALVFAPITALLFLSRQRAAGAHVVFALHLYSFVLALLSISLLLAYAELQLGGDGLRSTVVDHGLAILSVTACAAYIYLALKPVYGAHGGWRVAQAAFLAVSVAIIFIGYRFVIFLVTLYST